MFKRGSLLLAYCMLSLTLLGFRETRLSVRESSCLFAADVGQRALCLCVGVCFKTEGYIKRSQKS